MLEGDGVRHTRRIGILIILLRQAGLPSVHTLSLTNVYLKYGSDLFSGGKFPLLRNLCLKTCSGMHDLNINCPGLEILKLEDLELQALGVSGVGLLELEVKNCFKKYAFRWAKILAPSLQSLRWRSNITVEFTTESFRDLNTCSLYFPSEIQNAATLKNTSAFLSALCFARSLAVGSRVLETLSKINSGGGLPCSFDNLMTLEFHTNMTKDEITGMTCLLRSSPILHTITMSVNSCSNTKNESWNDYWKYQFQNLKLIEPHLKVARIDVQDTKMHYNALNLVKLLFGPGQALQEMTLTLSSNSVVPPLQQRRIRSQIMKIVQASCNVIVSFLPQD